MSARLLKPRHAGPRDGWRLPASELERLLVELLNDTLSDPSFGPRSLGAGDADALQTARSRLLDRVAAVRANEACAFDLIERVDLARGTIRMRLSAGAYAAITGCREQEIVADALVIHAPFTDRKRGVETKLYLGAPLPEHDHTLIRNIVTARRWLDDLTTGMSFAAIAAREGTSKRRVKDLVDLAMLSPRLLDRIAAGERPDGLATDALIKQGFPARWSEQERQFLRS
ncbi:hypothetical protein [Pontivivens ytuae]|uniref:hypothetical protein n=1 Tax=Pontivivens ytuae TaxID=2789856 RepID=UPI001E544610|nr:hypothetical protein [Pontivivens ytuae]